MISRLASGSNVGVSVGASVRVGLGVRVGLAVGDAVGVDVEESVGETTAVFVAGDDAVVGATVAVGTGPVQERHPRIMHRNKLPKMIRRFAFSLIRTLTFSRPPAPRLNLANESPHP